MQTPPTPKEFQLRDYDIIGFDLDGTLLRYNVNTMAPLEYELLRDFLVTERHYPAALGQQQLNTDFLQKGLVLDVERGNILKLSSDEKILKATHGTRELSGAEIRHIYGPAQRWDLARHFFEDPLSTWNGPLSQKIRALLDYFDITVSLLFGQAVDAIDAEAEAKGERPPLPYTVWADVQDGLTAIYTRENFANGRSGYFEALKAQPERYMLRLSPTVIEFLQQLRADGKQVYLLTGSNIDFADFTATFTFGRADWQTLFDCVVCFAKKPGFFTAERPFLRIEGTAEVPGSELPLDAVLPLQAAYSCGNWRQLKQSFAHKLGRPADELRCIYVGDNLIQDVYTPVKHHDMDALAVCEELLADAGGIASASEQEEDTYEYHDVLRSRFWGSYFCIDRKPTLWSSIIARYSQMCIPLIDSVATSSVANRHLCQSSLRGAASALAGVMVPKDFSCSMCA